MPGMDGTGPEFAGPMTGGSRGRCAGKNTMAGVNHRGNMGFGRGRGQGRNQSLRPRMDNRRFRNRPVTASDPAFSSNADFDNLMCQAAFLQQRLEALNVNIRSLKTKMAR